MEKLPPLMTSVGRSGKQIVYPSYTPPLHDSKKCHSDFPSRVVLTDHAGSPTAVP